MGRNKSGLCHLADKVGLKLAGEYGVHDTRATRRRNVRLQNKHQDNFRLQEINTFDRRGNDI
jgi:hypothetical protein